MDPSALIQRAQAGDASAYAHVVREHQSRVRGLLRRLTRGDAAVADELAQEVFLQAWRQLAGFQGAARFSTWLYAIAINVWRQHARSHRWEWALTDDISATDNGVSETTPEPHHAPEPLQHLQADVNQALARLPEAQRQALLLCYFDDLSHTEAASALGVPLGTLKTLVNRGKLNLRQQLAAWAPIASAEVYP